MIKARINQSLVFLSRRLVYAFALMLLCAVGQVSAQTVVGETGYSDRYLPNNLKSDWFIGIGGGGRLYFGDHDRQMEIQDRLSYGVGLHVGKWWSSAIGTRVGYSYQKIKGLTKTGWDEGGTFYEPTHSTGHFYPNPKDGSVDQLLEQEFNAGHIYGDVLLNLANLFTGITPERFYTPALYAGVGLLHTSDIPKEKDISASIGLLNLFRLSDGLDLTLDIRASAIDDSFDGEVGGRQQEGLLSIDLGLAYRFGKGVSRFEPSTLSAGELAALNDKINAISREKVALLDQISTLERDLRQPREKQIEKIVEWKDASSDIYIRFNLGKSDLSKEARVQLSFLADLLRKYPNGSYTITGYADSSTGTPSLNAKLSQSRARAVKDCLVNEFGVAASRLQLKAVGGVDAQYYDDPALSRSVVIRPNK
jgi:outer membrane protein OmpA-like peptidoglycan-associated protein